MEINDDIARAIETMRRGGTILYPTDTVWGIGCDACRPEAVRKIFEIKRRADSKALICLVGDLAQLERYVDGIPEVAYDLIESAVSPLTIVYDRGIGLAPELLAADGSVGVRLTREAISRRLCTGLRRPIVSTSANISGEPAPRSFDEISDEIKNAVDYVMASRRDEPAAASPSSVVKLTESGIITILRP